jgi:hypothetical protein
MARRKPMEGPLHMDMHAAHGGHALWKNVFVSTTHCAAGCVIGDIIGAPIVFSSEGSADRSDQGRHARADRFRNRPLRLDDGRSFQVRAAPRTKLRRLLVRDANRHGSRFYGELPCELVFGPIRHKAGHVRQGFTANALS